MSPGLQLRWEVLFSWLVLFLVVQVEIQAREVLTTSVDEISVPIQVPSKVGEDQVEDRSVGGNYKPQFDSNFNVPSSHGK